MAKRRKPKVTNQCVDHDVNLPTVRPAAKQPTSAADLSEGQLWVLVELWLRNRRRGHPADRVYSLFGFRPTDDDRKAIDWAIDLYRDAWKPQTDLIERELTPPPGEVK